MLRSIDSGGAALTQNQLSAAVTSGGAPLTRGCVELGVGACREFEQLVSTQYGSTFGHIQYFGGDIPS